MSITICPTKRGLIQDPIFGCQGRQIRWKKYASRHLNSRSGRDASRSEAHRSYRFRAPNPEDEWHQRSTATIPRESASAPWSSSSSPSAAALGVVVVAAARVKTVPCSSAWAHGWGQPINQRSAEKTYGYSSVRHSLTWGKALCQSGTEHAQIGRINTIRKQCLASRIVPGSNK